jgi:hypothetical protein
MKKTQLLVIKFLVALLLLFAILIGLIPSAIKWGTVYWLEQQGLEASIEKIDIDFNDGILNIINARGVNAQGNGFTVGRLHLDIAWKPLLDNIAVIEKIELAGFKLDAVQDTQGLISIAGLDLTNNKVSDKTEPAEESPTLWRIELGDVLLKDINSCYEIRNEEKSFCTHLDEFDWQGDIVFDAKKQSETQPKIYSSLTVKNIIIKDEKQQKNILVSKNINLDNLIIEGLNNIKLDKLLLTGLKVLPINDEKRQEKQIAQLDSLQVNNVQFENQQKMDIKQISLKGVGISMLLNKKKRLELTQRIDKILPKTPEVSPDQVSPEKNEQQGPSLKIKIAEFTLLESNPLVFIDKSLNTPFDISTIINKFSLMNIDTGNLNQSSQLELDLVTGKHGNINMQGDVQLLAESRSFDIKGKITGVDLRSLTSYIELALGHRVKSGQLNADLKLLSENGKMDSLLDVHLQHFQLKALTDEQKEKLDKKLGLGVPLNTALGLLRDKDNSINLELPITGDVNNPEFDPSDAVYTAASKAITFAIINYYTPFGLVNVAEGLFDLATALRFEPIEFDAGKSELGAGHNKSLDKISVLLVERPQLHLTVCGTSNNKDLNMLAPELQQQIKKQGKEFKLNEKTREKLLQVAGKRSEKVKQYLIDKKINADRLILCEPEFEQKGLSAVQISM